MKEPIEIRKMNGEAKKRLEPGIVNIISKLSRILKDKIHIIEYNSELSTSLSIMAATIKGQLGKIKDKEFLITIVSIQNVILVKRIK